MPLGNKVLYKTHFSLFKPILFSAKHMVRRVPSSIPYVKLGEGFRPSISDLRKQTKVGRVTTAEALAILFEVYIRELTMFFLNCLLGNE